MSKERKSPTILKPMIDETTALQFATAGTAPDTGTRGDSESFKKKPFGQTSAKKSSPGKPGKSLRQISLTLSQDIYSRIAKDAARKERTVEEHLIKHLTKRYGK